MRQKKTQIFENQQIKIAKSEDYNYVFNKETGQFIRWGRTPEDDPEMSPVGPEILDFEISEICNRECSFCYKSNKDCGDNTSLETVKKVLSKFPKTLTQVAYGIGSVKGNPELKDILEYSRSVDIIPNITVNGKDIEDSEITMLASLCGAVSVSNYNKDDCYGTIERLTEESKKDGMTLQQVNIHQLLSKETLKKCYQVIDDCVEDKRLENLNAIVFLMLKPKGERNTYHGLESPEEFINLFRYALEKGVQVGMDSCTAPFTLKAVQSLGMEEIIPSIEPCESSLFSIYVNVKGELFPCSFTEGEKGWETGIDLTQDNIDFIKDVWFNKRLFKWRKELLSSTKDCNCSMKSHCRSCPTFNITPCKED